MSEWVSLADQVDRIYSIECFEAETIARMSKEELHMGDQSRVYVIVKPLFYANS